MLYQYDLTISTDARTSHDVTRQVDDVVQASGIRTGFAHVFLRHTSASLMLCENADPDVRRDLEAFMNQLVTDGDEMFAHRTEGADDMAAHVRTVLTHSDLTVPVSGSRLSLGKWQGIYVWEHRYRGYDRYLTVTVQGE